MKMIIINSIIGLLASSVVFATTSTTANCQIAALEIAKLNLNQKAKSYGFSYSDISDTTITPISGKNTDALSYSVIGYIYKATYNITVSVDTSCGVEQVRIKEVL